MAKLYPEDQKKVDEYLSASIHQVERSPFRPWRLLLIIFASIGVVTLIAFLIASNHGVV